MSAIYQVSRLAVIALLSFSRFSTATSSLYLYSGSQCADSNPWTITGTTDGICTPIHYSFYSMEVAEIDVNCTFTVYGSENEYCGNGYKFALESNVCYGNYSPINQFTVDCFPPYPATTSSASPSSTPSPEPTPSLSTTDKIALGVGIPGSVLAVAIMGIWMFRRWRKRKNLMVAAEAGAGPIEVGEKGVMAEIQGKPIGFGHVSEIGLGSERQELDGGPPAELWGSDATTVQEEETWTHAL